MSDVLPLLIGALSLFTVLTGLWRLVQNRRLRAEARGWLEAGDWATFNARYDAASPAQRVVLLGSGQGRPELAGIYARALRGPWQQAAAAAEALRSAGELPPIVEAAAREQLGRRGMRGELLRALRPQALTIGEVRDASPAPKGG